MSEEECYVKARMNRNSVPINISFGKHLMTIFRTHKHIWRQTGDLKGRRRRRHSSRGKKILKKICLLRIPQRASTYSDGQARQGVGSSPSRRRDAPSACEERKDHLVCPRKLITSPTFRQVTGRVL
jgi:hypothetical protein